ncbi:hypothetical protein M9H77_08021 [Catharanthus roseus]|uniref:Uncharacterized protein n=1 Tax=Catharanthus roseus TaxID=4058 RepID=A0ACC0BWM2_CATRO|nr:hypothetical protein M9H77_08021 [Catharanthus roseus]
MGMRRKLGSFFMLLGPLWTSRNKTTFEQKDSLPKEVVQVATAWHMKYQHAQIPHAVGGGRAIHMEKWAKPIEGMLKISVDASFSGSRAGIGVVMRDFVGDVIAPMACTLLNVTEASQAELLAMREGCN